MKLLTALLFAFTLPGWADQKHHCPAAASSLLQAAASAVKPRARKSRRPAITEDASASVDLSDLRDALRGLPFDAGRKRRQLTNFAIFAAATLFILAVLCRTLRWFLSPKTHGSWTLKQNTPRRGSEQDSGPTTVPMDVDAYGAAVSSCVRDMQVLTLGEHHNADESIRAFRILASLFTLWTIMAIQGFIAYMVATQAAKVVVLKFRQLYDSFELAVYTEAVFSEHGFHRGEPSKFHPEGFADLSPIQMNTICQMPFANDIFLTTIIFVWTLSCVVDLRRAVSLFVDLTLMMPSVESLSGATCVEEAKDGEEGEVTIVGIPMGMKVFLSLTILIPRIVLDVVVLLLGCRWLVATSDMADLILNSMALEFILLLNAMVLQALVPTHGINGLSRTKMITSSSRDASALMALMATLSWTTLSVLWCISYVYFLQDVLPGYLWDVRGVCDVWRSVVSQES